MLHFFSATFNSVGAWGGTGRKLKLLGVGIFPGKNSRRNRVRELSVYVDVI